MTNEDSIMCEESLDSKLSSTLESTSGDILTSGLSNDNSESALLAKAFWEVVWPHLQENGWERRVVAPHMFDLAGSTILATKKNLDLATSIERQDYYVSIKDVIERINRRQNAVESTAADRYRRAISRHGFRKLRSANDLLKEVSSNLDLSWKDGGTHFPKKSSSIGENYQVSSIPVAGSCGEIDNPGSDIYSVLVWDPRKAHQKGVVLEEGKDLISRLTHNIRESALFELAQLNYDVDTFQSSAINRLKPSDGSDWSQEQKKKFHSEVFRLRRDLRSVSKAMGVPLKTCHAYYLGTYKSTCEYRLLKTVCIGERESNATNVEEDACAICGDGGSLLICDGCEGEYHMTCMQPPLRVVPEGHWLCDECVDRRVLEARAFFIRHSTLFDEVVVNMPNNKKRFADQLHGDTKHASISNVATMENLDGSGEVFYRPVDPFVEAAREFSRNISKVFSKTGDD